MSEFKTFTNPSNGYEYGAFEVSPGIWRWKESGNLVPLDAAKELNIPVNEERQAAAIKADLAALFQSFKDNPPPPPSQEELYEMKAAFGEGTKVVNVITGQTTQL